MNTIVFFLLTHTQLTPSTNRATSWFRSALEESRMSTNIVNFVLSVFSSCQSLVIKTCKNIIFCCKKTENMSNFDTKKFISEIKKRPSIWDTSSIENTNKELKRRNWNEIVALFEGDDITSSDRHLLGLTLQKRWKNIRTCFARELKRQKNYGSGANRKSEYIYYKQLLFLSNVMNIAEKETDDEPEYVYYDDNELELNQSVAESKYDPKIENRFKRKLIDEEDTIDDNEDNEDRLFLLSLHETLRRIPKNKKMAVKIKMLSIINDAVTEADAD